jgi:hypothetical protein
MGNGGGELCRETSTASGLVFRVLTPEPFARDTSLRFTGAFTI